MSKASFAIGDRVEIATKYRKPSRPGHDRRGEGCWVKARPGEFGVGTVADPVGVVDADLIERIPVLWDDAEGVPSYVRGRTTVVPASRLRKVKP